MRSLLRIFLVGLVFIAFAPRSQGTVQISDSFTVDGEKGSIEELPLQPLLTKRRIEFEVESTANYKGYRATWKIEKDRLYLDTFSGFAAGETKPLAWLFPNAKGKVLADWYSGPIHVSLGPVVARKIHGHVVITERLAVFTIKDGVVTERKVYKYPESLPVINKLVSATLGRKVDVRRIPY